MPIEVRTCIDCMCPIEGPVEVNDKGDCICNKCLQEEKESLRIILETENLMLFSDSTLIVIGCGQDLISISIKETEQLYQGLKKLGESKGEEV